MALTDNLTAFWELATVNDAHGANHLTNNNTVTFVSGKVGNCANFVLASSQSLSIADNAALSVGNIDFTFALWVYLDSKATTLALLSKYNTTSDNREYLLLYAPAAPVADRFNWRVNPTGLTSVDTIVSATSFGSPSLATWYFLVVDHDATANTISIQVNNGTIDSAAHTTGVFNGAALFSLGSFNGGSFHDGREDQVGFWKRILTAEERTWLYNTGVGRPYAEVLAGMPLAATTPINFSRSKYFHYND